MRQRSPYDPRVSSLSSRLVPSAYRPALADPVFRRLLVGFGVSDLGDGMSFVAVAWLALELAPRHSEGLWVGAAVAAYTLPGVLGALLLGRRAQRIPARWLVIGDGLVRGVLLGLVPLTWLAGWLTPVGYVALLAGSSLLHAWGHAGKYTLVADLVPDEHRLPANSLLSSLTWAATIAGPALAGLLVTYVSTVLVIGLDALTFLFLAALVAATALPKTRPEVAPEAKAGGGVRMLRSHPELLALLVLTWFFNALYGPVEVALPLHVSADLGAPGTLLGGYWMLFGVGALVGGLTVGGLRQLPLWPVLTAIVVGWGACLLPFGVAGVPVAVTVVCFAIGGAIYGPFLALSMTLMQQRAPRHELAALLAVRSAALLTAAPVGTALGGPLVTAFGPRATLAGSGLATIALGLVAGVALLTRRP